MELNNCAGVKDKLLLLDSSCEMVRVMEDRAAVTGLWI